MLPPFARTSRSRSWLNKDNAIGTAKKSEGGKERDRVKLSLIKERERYNGLCRGYETVLYRWTRAAYTKKCQECVRSHRVSVAVSRSLAPRRGSEVERE